jgi:hypothetical protein
VEYQGLDQKTLRRDLDLLAAKELLIVEKSKYRANFGLLHSLLPETCVTLKRHF